MLANFSARMSKYTDIKEGNYAQSTMPEIRKILEIKPQATYADVRNVLISNALFQAVKQNT